MIRLYSNENFPLPVVIELRQLGYDVLTTHDTGHAGQAISDDLVLEFAHTNKRALLTFNRRHFINLHLKKLEHSGIIACTFDPDFSGLAHRIHKTLANLNDLSGQLIRINRPSPMSDIN